MAATALYDRSRLLLSVFGDEGIDSINLSRAFAGRILINGGAITAPGSIPTVGNTSLVQFVGGGGDDTISFSEDNGRLPIASISGGEGDDRITTGSGADLMFGDAGADILSGRGGADEMYGGADNDLLYGGPGSDRLHGDGGDDRLVWKQGDQSDRFDGGEGTDTADITGYWAGEALTVIADGARIKVNRTNVSPFTLDLGTTEVLRISTGAGHDRIQASGDLAAVQLSVDAGIGHDKVIAADGADFLSGGEGNDVLEGRAGIDTLNGGPGADVLSGGAGDDLVHGEGGDDRFVWKQGDHSDLFEGGDGTDTAVITGFNASEVVDIASEGSRLHVSRSIPYVFNLDIGTTEKLVVNGGAGGDTISAAADSNGSVKLTLDGGTGNDIITGGVGADRLLGGGGNDRVTGGRGTDEARLGTGDDSYFWEMGDGQDRVFGDDGSDAITLSGERSDDFFVIEASGSLPTLTESNDPILAIVCVETVVWQPLEGADYVYIGDLAGTEVTRVIADLAAHAGGDAPDDNWSGDDLVGVSGTESEDVVSIAVTDTGFAISGLHAEILVRNAGLDDEVALFAMGGADSIVVDHSGPLASRLIIDVSDGPHGTVGDEAADRVVARFGDAEDMVLVVGGAGTMGAWVQAPSGPYGGVELENADDDDTVVVELGAGSDTLDADQLGTDAGRLEVDGGGGDDAVAGSAGDDLISGGAGDDTAFMGAGDDIFVWNAGDGEDLVGGGDEFGAPDALGTDTLRFNGSDTVDEIQIVAGDGATYVGGQGAAAVLSNVEEVHLQPGGGADQVTVNGLTGGGVERVVIDLAGAGGGGDGDVDVILITASYYPDVITVTGADGSVTVTGLAAELLILNMEAIDRLIIDGWSGDDKIDASGLETPVCFLADGDEGDDILIGTFGDDTLLGGPGTDVLLGNGGSDTLNQDGWFVS